MLIKSLVRGSADISCPARQIFTSKMSEGYLSFFTCFKRGIKVKGGGSFEVDGHAAIPLAVIRGEPNPVAVVPVSLLRRVPRPRLAVLPATSRTPHTSHTSCGFLRPTRFPLRGTREGRLRSAACPVLPTPWVPAVRRSLSLRRPPLRGLGLSGPNTNAGHASNPLRAPILSRRRIHVCTRSQSHFPPTPSPLKQDASRGCLVLPTAWLRLRPPAGIATTLPHASNRSCRAYLDTWLRH